MACLLHLVRHGQFETGPGPVDLDTDGELTPAGARQADLLAERLRDVPLAAIHHSTLIRATRTAERIAAHHPGVPVEPSDLLRECVPAVPPRDQLTPAQASWFDGWSDLPSVLVDGPVQAAAAFARYADPGGDEVRRELVVSHGNLINWFAARALDAPPAAWMTPTDYHCGLTTILYRAGEPARLVTYNDVGHLPADLRGLDVAADVRI